MKNIRTFEWNLSYLYEVIGISRFHSDGAQEQLLRLLLLRRCRLFAQPINPQRQLHSTFCRIEPKHFFRELNGSKLHNADGNAQAFPCEGISAVPVARSCVLLCILWWFERINEKKIAEAQRCLANFWTLILLLFFRVCLFSLLCSCWELKTGFRYEREREMDGDG